MRQCRDKQYIFCGNSASTAGYTTAELFGMADQSEMGSALTDVVTSIATRGRKNVLATHQDHEKAKGEPTQAKATLESAGAEPVMAAEGRETRKFSMTMTTSEETVIKNGSRKGKSS